MAVRNIKPSFRSITGFHGASGQEFESTLEADMMTLLQFDLDIDHFESQPLTLRYLDPAGTERSYTPDLLIYYKSVTAKPPLLCEVKYRHEYRGKFSELRPKYKAATRFAKVNGMRFGVMTDREIRTPYLANAKFLLPYRNREPDAAHCHMLLDALGQHRAWSPQELLSTLSQDKLTQAAILPALWHLIANFIVQADLSTKLTMDSRIHYADQGDES